jgi:hypothetical protein
VARYVLLQQREDAIESCEETEETVATTAGPLVHHNTSDSMQSGHRVTARLHVHACEPRLECESTVLRKRDSKMHSNNPSFFQLWRARRVCMHSDTRPSSHSPATPTRADRSHSPATPTRADRVSRSLVPDRALFFRPLVAVIREGVICRCLTDGPHKRTRHPQSAQKRELHCLHSHHSGPHRHTYTQSSASLSTCDGPQNESGQRAGATRRQCSGDQ